MIGYPIMYGDTLERGNGFKSETVLTKISEYWSNEDNQANFNRGPGPNPAKAGSLANVPTPDRGAFGAGALGICAIVMKSGAYWVGFVCAAAVIIGARMAAVLAND